MRASKLLHRILKFIMQIYANLFKINEKCYFSVISWPILILFVLSDRAWCRLQNFYTEFWNSLIMQIYANLFKINEKCYVSVISWPIWFCLFYLIGLGAGFKTSTEFWKSLIMQIYSKPMKNALQICTSGGDVYITHRVIYYPLVYYIIIIYAN